WLKFNNFIFWNISTACAYSSGSTRTTITGFWCLLASRIRILSNDMLGGLFDDDVGRILVLSGDFNFYSNFAFNPCLFTFKGCKQSIVKFWLSRNGNPIGSRIKRYMFFTEKFSP